MEWIQTYEEGFLVCPASERAEHSEASILAKRVLLLSSVIYEKRLLVVKEESEKIGNRLEKKGLPEKVQSSPHPHQP